MFERRLCPLSLVEHVPFYKPFKKFRGTVQLFEGMLTEESFKSKASR